MSRFNQNREPAKWTRILDSETNACYVSDGGGVKFTHKDEHGQERPVLTFAGSQADKIEGMMDFIQASFGKIRSEVSAVKEKQDRERLALKAQVQANKAIENLKALGLTPEQLAQALTGKVS